MTVTKLGRQMLICPSELERSYTFSIVSVLNQSLQIVTSEVRIVNQLWLVENRIVDREAFQPGCVFTDMLVHVISQEFVLFVQEFNGLLSGTRRRCSRLAQALGCCVRDSQ